MLPADASRRAAGAVAAFSMLTACRADSIMTPDGAAVATTAVADTLAAVPMADAVARIMPVLADTPAGHDLAALLTRLDTALHAGRTADARLALAQAYALLDKLDVTQPESAPDHDAVRLSLIPIADALGVR